MLLKSNLPPAYEISVGISIVLALSIVCIAWQRRDSPGAAPLLVRLIATACFLAAYVVPLPSDWVTADMGVPYLRFRMLALAFVFIPPAFLALVLEFTGRVKTWRWWGVALLLAEPAVVWYLALVPSSGSIFFGSWRGLPADGVFVPTAAFKLHTLYSYSLVAIAVAILVRQYTREAGCYRRQLGILILAVIPPSVAAGATIAGLTPVIHVQNTIIHMDFTPQAFLISDAMIAYALFMHGYLDIVPVARNVVIEQMGDGVLVCDSRDRIMDINPSAARLLAVDSRKIFGMEVQRITLLPLELVTEARDRHAVSRTVLINDRYIDLRAMRLSEFAPNLSSVLIVMRDVTDTKRSSEQLEAANRALQNHLAEIERMQALLREQALRDSLTGLYNRHYMEDTLERELAHFHRTGTPLAVIMIDIDHFKRINDTYGHLNGDEMLRTLGQILQSQSREEDIACRFGGEEFLIILRNTSPEIALERADEWRRLFVASQFCFNGHAVTATFSAGVAGCPTHSTERTALLGAADQALYSAKASGRNRVLSASALSDISCPELKGVG